MYAMRKTRPVMDRFWEKVDKDPMIPGSCWIWKAMKNQKGYGRFCMTRSGVPFRAMAHRVAYESVLGLIPDGLQIDHLCRVRCCVNPSHMEPVTCKENVLRGFCPSAMSARATHCPGGHEWGDSNTRWNIRGGYRQCRICDKEWKRARASRLLAAESEGE